MPHPSTVPAGDPAPAVRPLRNLRWIICGLLFIATTINYVDRQTLGLLNKEILQREIGWDDIGFAWILFAFQVAYAVMGFGGFLGLGEDHYPIPWQRLTYNEKLGGYEVNLTDEQLKNAPRYATGEEWKWDPARGRDIYDYYGVAPYWPMM